MNELKLKMQELLKQIAACDDRAKKSDLLAEAESLKADIEMAEKEANLTAWGNRSDGTVANTSGSMKGADLIKLSQGENLVEQEGTLSEKAMRLIAEPSYKSAWIRHAHNPNLMDRHDLEVLNSAMREAKNFVEGLDQGGGYLVPAAIQMEIIRRDPQLSGVLDAVRTLPVASSDRLQAPRLDYRGVSADDANGDIFSNPMRLQWTGEAQVPGTTTRPDFGQIEIPIFEGQFEMPFSRSLAEDSGLFESLLVEELRNSYQLGMENVIINGNGIQKPSGILLNPGGLLQPPTQNVGNAVTADGLTDWIYSLPPQYAGDICKWLTNRTDVFRTWAKIKDTANNYIFGLTMNISGGLATARSNVLFGYNGMFSPFMPNSGAAANVGVFGNFKKAYWFAERLGMTVAFQDIPREAFRYAVVRYRVGGQVVQPRALRVAVQS